MAPFLRNTRMFVRWADAILAWGLIFCVRIYQKLLSPDHSIWARALSRPPYCRHIPSCSDYAIQSLSTHGGVRGGWLAVRRVARCVPWKKWGYDPVPQKCGDHNHRHE